MPDCITNFFDAWKIEESETRLAKLNYSVINAIQYDDPRTPETVNGIAALNAYVGMFSANAPGWSAKVIKTDTVAGIIRATVAFGGMGPDGSEKVQLGQYFVETDGDLVSRMVGFVGTGEQN